MRPIDYYYIVSGAHRSGTSMMMHMLEAGGMAVSYSAEKDEQLKNKPMLLSDYDPNPNGFYEGGKPSLGVASKRIAKGLPALKLDAPIKMIFMIRPRKERKASLSEWGWIGWQLEERLKTKSKIDEFIAANKNIKIEIMYLKYIDALTNPAYVFGNLLKLKWPIDNADGFCSVPNMNLYRHRDESVLASTA